MPKIDTRRRPAATASRPEPRSRLQRFASEVRLTAAFIGWVLLSLSLLSFHKSDPSWSSSGTDGHVANWVGVVGAWLSDIAYFLLGFSALWLIPLGLYGLLRLWRRTQAEPAQVEAPEAASRWRKLQPLAAVAGLLLLPLSSAALESTRLWSLAAGLPGDAGGLLGHACGMVMDTLLGDTGGTLVLLAVFLFSLSWVGHFSWADAAEHLGRWIERLWAWQRDRRGREDDVLAGQQAMQEREKEVELQRPLVEEREVLAPVLIEPSVAFVPPSPRVLKEKQKPLFNELPDSALPALSLLDAAPAVQAETVSHETLEFTSRLIEKKLKDFGVEVRVVAAYPGPVITRYEVEPATGV